MKNNLIKRAYYARIHNNWGYQPFISLFIRRRISLWLLLRFVIDKKGFNIGKLAIFNILRGVGTRVVEYNSRTNPQLLYASLSDNMSPVSSMVLKPLPKLGRLSYVKNLSPLVDSVDTLASCFSFALNFIKGVESCPLNLKALNSHLNESLSLPNTAVNHIIGGSKNEW